eukprot:TRINITY_DN596_c0_g2_i1.p1 TRINITY_DN596_c0_g2~~TRINITY_DN596_c0_g2_i1.p1  ORF type:complete len:1409 (+),score=269.69 TRINITY_DN596_c0_g2_i1:4-4230(+)
MDADHYPHKEEVIPVIRAIAASQDAVEKLRLLDHLERVFNVSTPGPSRNDHTPNLIRDCLPELLELVRDPITPMKLFVCNIIKLLPSCNQPASLPMALVPLSSMLREADGDLSVLRSAIECVSCIFVPLLRFINQAQPEVLSPALSARIWDTFQQTKTAVIDIILKASLSNTGVLVRGIKLIELVVLAFSSPERDKRQSVDQFVLDDISPAHPVLVASALAKEGRELFQHLLTRVTNQPNCNIALAVVNSLTVIARRRTYFANMVIPAFTKITISPSLSGAQEDTVRHTLRNGLLSIFKSPASCAAFSEPIADALEAIGAHDAASRLRRSNADMFPRDKDRERRDRDREREREREKREKRDLRDREIKREGPPDRTKQEQPPDRPYAGPEAAAGAQPFAPPFAGVPQPIAQPMTNVQPVPQTPAPTTPSDAIIGIVIDSFANLPPTPPLTQLPQMNAADVASLLSFFALLQAANAARLAAPPPVHHVDVSRDPRLRRSPPPVDDSVVPIQPVVQQQVAQPPSVPPAEILPPQLPAALSISSLPIHSPSQPRRLQQHHSQASTQTQQQVAGGGSAASLPWAQQAIAEKPAPLVVPKKTEKQRSVSREPPKLRPAPPLSKELIQQFGNAALYRILQQNCDTTASLSTGGPEVQLSGVKISGAQHLRTALLVKLACVREVTDPAVTRLLDYISENFPARQALGVTWLYQEYMNAREAALADLPVTTRPLKRARTEKTEQKTEQKTESTDDSVKTESDEPTLRPIKTEPLDSMDTLDEKDKGKEIIAQPEDDLEQEVEIVGELTHVPPDHLQRYEYVFTELVTRLNNKLTAPVPAATMMEQDEEQEDKEKGEEDGEATAVAQQMSKEEEDALGALFTQLLLEAPVISAVGFSTIQTYCEEPKRVQLGLNTLQQLITERPNLGMKALEILLSYTIHSEEYVRSPAIKLVSTRLFLHLQLYTPTIRTFATETLQAMTERVAAMPKSVPKGDVDAYQEKQEDEEETEEHLRPAATSASMDVSGNDNNSNNTVPATTTTRKRKREQENTAPDTTVASALEEREDAQEPGDGGTKKEEAAGTGNSQESDSTEEYALRHILLYFALCPRDHPMLLPFIEIYRTAPAVVKKVIHKHAADLIRSIGMYSPSLLQVIETCPDGAETFVLLALHTLTDNAVPTPQLVTISRRLFTTRQDARFLIPILSGLDKDDTLNLLGTLVALPANQMKVAFHKLLNNKPTSVTPEELLVALHTLDSKEKAYDLRKVIAAINFCFSQRTVYKQPIMAVVLQQLADVSPIPPLFMRTVIQAVGAFPKLMGFIMGILSRLIHKQIWQDKSLWSGFVQCAKTTLPHSCPVVLQLPPPQMKDVIMRVNTMRAVLLKYIEEFPHSTNLSAAQRAVLDENESAPVAAGEEETSIKQ